jgi:hypothetical protein
MFLFFKLTKNESKNDLFGKADGQPINGSGKRFVLKGGVKKSDEAIRHFASKGLEIYRQFKKPRPVVCQIL